MNLGQVFTNKNIADYMATLFSLSTDAKILDPCFGKGVFINTMQEKGYTKITGVEIDPTLYVQAKSTMSSVTLINGDFLSFDNEDLFDGIIMNPPYIRQEEIDKLKEIGISKSILLENKLFKKLSAKSNLYMYFILKAISLLKKDGELIVIFPSSWINSKCGKNFKSLIEEECFIQEHICISGQIFESKALIDVIILKIKKSKQKSKTIYKNLQFINNEIIEINQNSQICLDFKSSFKNMAYVKRGITTGCNALFINPPIINKKNLQTIISSPKQISSYKILNKKYDKMFVPNHLDDESLNYINYWTKKILTEQSPKTIYKDLAKKEPLSCFKTKLFNCQGLLFSYFIRKDIKFMLNDTNYLVRDNFYIIQSPIDKYLMFALLNNYYVFYQLECFGKKHGNGLLKIQTYDINELKLPSINEIIEDDKNKLIKLTHDLIKNNTKDLLLEITKVISKYTNVSADDILKCYLAKQKQRLEEK